YATVTGVQTCALPICRHQLLGRRGLSFLRPGHHGAQLRAHALDQVVVLLPPHPLEVRAATLALLDPLARERAALDVGENLSHARSEERRVGKESIDRV